MPFQANLDLLRHPSQKNDHKIIVRSSVNTLPSSSRYKRIRLSNKCFVAKTPNFNKFVPKRTALISCKFHIRTVVNNGSGAIFQTPHFLHGMNGPVLNYTRLKGLPVTSTRAVRKLRRECSTVNTLLKSI